MSNQRNIYHELWPNSWQVVVTASCSWNQDRNSDRLRTVFVCWNKINVSIQNHRRCRQIPEPREDQKDAKVQEFHSWYSQQYSQHNGDDPHCSGIQCLSSATDAYGAHCSNGSLSIKKPSQKMTEWNWTKRYSQGFHCSMRSWERKSKYVSDVGFALYTE